MANCCNGGVGRFEVLPAQPDIWAQWDPAKMRYVVKTPLSTVPSSLTSSTASTTSSATSTASSNASQQTSATETSASPNGSQLPTQTGQVATNQPPSTEPSQSSSGLSTAAQAGVGVAAAVGALLIAAVAYLWWKLHKSGQARRGSGSGPQWQGPQDAYPTSQPSALLYSSQDLRRKFELQGHEDTQELQGQHYFLHEDASGAELTTQPSYAAESPVTTGGIAR